MIDKQLDEAINTWKMSHDLAWEAALELRALQRGEHPDLVLVPREPTYEMCNAGKWAAFEHCCGIEELEEYAADNEECSLIYKAMIAAARKDELE